MFKNTKNKLLLVILLTITLITPICFAENETVESATDTTSNIVDDSVPTEASNTDESTNANSSTSDESNEPVSDDYSADGTIDDATASDSNSQNIHEGDLYLAGDEVTMDQLVNGNVYIAANNVKVTGQVAGNIFIAANKIDFEDAYIESSAFIFANEVNFKAVASDLYICCNNLNIPTNYGVYRDIRSFANSSTLLGIIGRNGFCNGRSIKVQDGDSKVTVYGNFEYSAPSEVEFPEGAVQGETKFNKIESNENKTNIVSDYIIPGFSAIVFNAAIYGLFLWLAKATMEKCTKIASNPKWSLISLGIGLLACIAVPIISILLLISVVGVSLAFTLVGLIIMLLMIAKTIAIISYSNVISNKANIKNGWLKFLVVLGVTLVLYLISLIPFVGAIISSLISLLGLGILLVNIFFKKATFEKKA